MRPLGPTKTVPLDPVLYTKTNVDQIKQVMTHYSVTGEGNAGWAEMQELLLRLGLAWHEEVPSNQVATSPYNRKGAGVQGADSQAHGDEVTKGGFVKKLAEDTAVASQKNPHDDWEVDWNKDQQARSSGLIPPLHQVVRCCSLGTSHTSVFMRQLKARVRAVVKSLADPHGMIDTDRILNGKPVLQHCMDNGWTWFILHYQLEEAVPGISDWVQTCLNIKAAAERSEVEVMISLWTEASSTDTPDWKSAQSKQAKTLAPSTKYLPALVAFLQVHTGTLLHEIPMMWKAFEREGVAPVIGGELLGVIADIKFPEKVPYVGTGLLKLALLSPRVVDGFAKSLSMQKVKLLKSAKKAAICKLIDKTMEMAREIATRMEVSDNPMYPRAVTILDMRLLCHVMELRKVYEEREFETLEEISEDIAHFRSLSFS